MQYLANTITIIENLAKLQMRAAALNLKLIMCHYWYRRHGAPGLILITASAAKKSHLLFATPPLEYISVFSYIHYF